MGADIHAYLEYSENGSHWRALTDGAGERNYLMFGVVAGVRVPDVVSFKPKGMPDGNWSYVVEGAYWLSVAPDDHPEYADWSGWTSMANAERYVRDCGSIAKIGGDGRLGKVSHPDWHSHSWLTADEVGSAIEAYKIESAGRWGDASVPHDWAAFHAAMKAIEDNGGMARLVFWFDN